MINQVANAIADLNEIVRGDIRCHAHCDTSGTVEKKIGQSSRQNCRLFGLIIIIWNKIYCIFVDVTQQLVGNSGHLGLGVAHRRWGIIILRTKIALP